MASDELRRIAADLREARRYIRTDSRSNTEEVRKQAGCCVAAINGILVRRDVPVSEREYQVLERLGTNLAVGLRYIEWSPLMVAGYLTNAAFELDILAGPIEVPEVEVV